MPTFFRHYAGPVLSVICLSGIVAISPRLTLARVNSTDAPFSTATPTATSLPTEEGWEVAEPFDSPLPTSLPTVTPEDAGGAAFSSH